MTPALTFESARPLVSTATQAHLLSLLDRLYLSSKLVRDGARVTAPRVQFLAERLGVNKSTVSRALRALADRGLIWLERGWWNRSPRLYVRVLEVVRNVTGCAAQHDKVQGATSCLSSDNQGKHGSLPGEPGGAAEPAKKGLLKGKLDTLPEPKEKNSNQGPAETPTKIAHRWRGLAVAAGHPPFEVSPKTLRHVRLCMDRFAAAGAHLPDEVERVVDDWAAYRHSNAGPHPVPWAVLRSVGGYLEYRKMKSDAAVESVDPPTPAVVESVPPKPKGPSSLVALFKELNGDGS